VPNISRSLNPSITPADRATVPKAKLGVGRLNWFVVSNCKVSQQYWPNPLLVQIAAIGVLLTSTTFLIVKF
jgi:hypothetical protein